MRSTVRAEHRQALAGERGEHWWFRARRDILAAVLDARLPAAPARILEVGAGPGANLPALTPRSATTVLDIDLTALHSCRCRGAALAVQADAGALPFADRSFGLVTALDVLEHLRDDVAAAAEWRRVLRPGGLLIVTVPALPCLWGRQDVLSEHLRRYRAKTLERVFDRAGLALEHLTYFNSILLPPIFCVRLLMRPFLARSVRRGRSDLHWRAPAAVEALLHRVMASERRWVAARSLPLGVSLLALARTRRD